jgi:predicted 3-demethylubiquinone-9 3-methyltransferase (glyoxalase superfamily)
MRQKIVPCLWFDGKVEEAARFYTSVFKKSRILHTNHYGKSMSSAAGMPEGAVLTVSFQIEGQEFVLLNGGPQFKINPAMSFYVHCDSKEEVDALWKSLSPGGEVRMELGEYPFSPRYGWIEDRFGVSWQLNFQPTNSQKIKPLLMFSGEQWGRAEEAMGFYSSVFPDSGIRKIYHYGAEYPGPTGKVVHALFALCGQEFMAMDSHSEMPIDFSIATSFMVRCESQVELDTGWKALSAHPEWEQCGWLKDRYGLSWQLVPANLEELINDQNPERSERVMSAILKMKKLDLNILEKEK